MNHTDLFKRIAAQIEQAKTEHERVLEKDLFLKSLYFYTPRKPPTWRDKLQWRLWPIQRYFRTLWFALKGHDFYDSY